MELPQQAAVMVLPNAILFPQQMLPLYIFEPRYRRMLADTLCGGRMFCVTLQRPGKASGSPASVGGLGLIRACVTRPDGTSHLVLQGLCRVTLHEVVRSRPYRVHRIQPVSSTVKEGVVLDALVAKVRELAARRLQQGFLSALPSAADGVPLKWPQGAKKAFKHNVERFSRHIDKMDNPEQLVDLVSYALLSDVGARQTILETINLNDRLRHLIRFLQADIASCEQDDQS